MSVIVSEQLFCFPSAGNGVSITGGGTGSFQASGFIEISSASDARWALAAVVVGNGSGSWSDLFFVVQIATGTAGNEVVVAEYPIYGPNSGSQSLRYLMTVPLDVIPNNTRVSAQLLNVSGSNTYTVAIQVYKTIPGTVPASSKFHSYYPNAALGVSLTTSGSAWNDSGFGTITTGISTDQLILGAVVTNPTATTEWELDIYFGPDSSEVLKTTIRGSNRSDKQGDYHYYILPRAYPLAKNTQVKVKIRRSGTTVTTERVTLLTVGDSPGGGAGKGGKGRKGGGGVTVIQPLGAYIINVGNPGVDIGST